MTNVEIVKTTKKSYHYDPDPDLEKSPGQLNCEHPQSAAQPEIRQRKEDDIREKKLQEPWGYGTQGDRALYQPNLWWFISTVFPLIAGTFGPLANLFSVCSLVQTWRIKNGIHIPDPSWLTALNSCSLFLAILANLILLFNFAHRIRYAVAQSLTTSLWYLSSALLTIPICLTRLARLSPSTHPGFEYSQSFYYAIISSSLYFTISTLLLINFIGASRFFRAYPPTFAVLTYSQRTLMLQTISFSFYLALGSGVFSAIEGWNFMDGVYWADYTLLTIGFGSDFPLKRTGARMLLIPYAAFGITLIGLIVSSVRGLVLERAKEKVVMRHLEKERDRWTDNIKKTLKNEKPKAPRPMSLLFCWHYHRDKKFQNLPGVIAHAKSEQHEDKHSKWHHAEFELMRYIQMTGEQSEQYIALMVSFLAVLIVWIGGSLVFWTSERRHQEWTYIESLYFTYTTLLTIGYGDFFPVSQAGKPFFVVWSLVAVPAMTVLIGTMGDTVVRALQEITDWMGRWTVLPEYREKGANKREGDQVDVKNDQALSESDRQRSTSDQPLASPVPSLSRGRTLPVRNYADVSLQTSEEGQDTPTAPQVEPSLERGDEETPVAGDPYALQNSHQSGGHSSIHSRSQVQAEAALLAREISKLAKDVRQHPPKKYGWEELVTWLELLGDEGVANKLEIERKDVSINLPQTSTNHAEVEHLHGQHYREHHRRYTSHQINRNLEIGQEFEGEELEWNWTWLDDNGPLFSQQTEAEWILSKLCGRLEHLLND